MLAIVLDRGGGGGAALAALEKQSRRPDQALVLAPGPERAAGVGAADADWVWLLDDDIAPRPDALEALLTAAVAWPKPDLCLLASQIVGPDGSLLEAEAPVPRVLDPDLAAEAFEHRACLLRIVGNGSLLVRAEVLRDAPPPDTPGAELAWSARLLAESTGLLVPQSVAVRRQAAGHRRDSGLIAAWIRLLSSDALPTREKLWIAFIYAERAVALIRRSARGRR